MFRSTSQLLSGIRIAILGFILLLSAFVPTMYAKEEKEFLRKFVPMNADLGKGSDIEPLFQKLLDRKIKSVPELEGWLLDWSELSACLSQEGIGRYIRMTCHTDDPDLEKKHLEFVEQIEPQIKPSVQKLNEKFSTCEFRTGLNPDRYQVLERNIGADLKLFRQENIPIQTEENLLKQKYQKLCGAMTVQFDGQERTLPQMAKFQEETDRSKRQQAWETVAKRRLQDREEINKIYDQMVELRTNMALNAGEKDYRGYAFRMYKRFDYTPADCERFHQAIEQWVVPLSRKLAEKRRALLKVDPLRPWDLSVDLKGRPPLRPFKTAEELVQGVQKIFSQLNPDLAAQFAEMNRRKELDLDSRKGKAPGGYQETLNEIRQPFIFMNAAGVHRDVQTLLHESGHSFHALASRNDPLVAYRYDVPVEFAEVASMSMELFGVDHYDVFYSPEDAARAKRNQLEFIINFFPWMARVDAFQHWIYSHPKHSHEERSQAWLDLEKRFDGRADWSGYEDAKAAEWHRQLHFFTVPFYYVEYGIAELGALQLWQQFKQDPDEALKNYRNAVALGGSRPLPELFAAAKIQFDFSENTLRPLMKMVEEELAKIPD